jgi:hypothetical protein
MPDRIKKWAPHQFINIIKWESEICVYRRRSERKGNTLVRVPYT